ncbi:hypothetical protein MMPV_009059 [Pyropia vietnamensis]
MTCTSGTALSSARTAAAFVAAVGRAPGGRATLSAAAAAAAAAAATGAAAARRVTSGGRGGRPRLAASPFLRGAPVRSAAAADVATATPPRPSPLPRPIIAAADVAGRDGDTSDVATGGTVPVTPARAAPFTHLGDPTETGGGGTGGSGRGAPPSSARRSQRYGRPAPSRKPQWDNTAAAPVSMFAADTSFAALGVQPGIVEGLATAGVTTPTRAQATALPPLLSAAAGVAAAAAGEGGGVGGGRGRPTPGGVYVLAAETGSGKSLAYLLPLVQALGGAPSRAAVAAAAAARAAAVVPPQPSAAAAAAAATAAEGNPDRAPAASTQGVGPTWDDAALFENADAANTVVDGTDGDDHWLSESLASASSEAAWEVGEELPPSPPASSPSPLVGMRGVVLVPSRELAAQTLAFLAAYFPAPHTPSAAVLASTLSPAALAAADILIATPGSLRNAAWALNRDASWAASVKYVVVDEADMLMAGGFAADVEALLDGTGGMNGWKPRRMRRNADAVATNASVVVFAGATYPQWEGERVKSVVNTIHKRYPEAVTLATPGLHRRSGALSETWVPVGGEGLTEPATLDALGRVLAEAAAAADGGATGAHAAVGAKTLVFANTAAAAAAAARYLVAAPGVAAAYGGVGEVHGNVPAADRAAALAAFVAGEQRLLVATDLAARGLDLGRVCHVVQAEFAANVVGYVHRVGRAARASGLAAVGDRGGDGGGDDGGGGGRGRGGLRGGDVGNDAAGAGAVPVGRVTHFYDDAAAPLAEAIRDRIAAGLPVVEGVFSHKRSFRRKWKKNLIRKVD